MAYIKTVITETLCEHFLIIIFAVCFFQAINVSLDSNICPVLKGCACSVLNISTFSEHIEVIAEVPQQTEFLLKFLCY